MTRPLTRPLTLFGLVIGLCAAIHWISFSLEKIAGAIIWVGVTTAACHVLGRWLTRSIDWWKTKTLVVGTVAGMLFVVVIGTIAEFWKAGPHSDSVPVVVLTFAIVGGLLGLLLALPFLVPLTLVMRAARRVGRARQYSVIDRSDRRMLWLAWAGALLVWNATAVAWKANSGPYAAGFLVAFFTYWLLHNRVELARLRAFAVVGERRRDQDGPPIDPRDRRLTDYGIGDEEWEQYASPFGVESPYRAGPELRRVIRGDRELAAAALKEVRWLALAGLVLSIGCLVAHLLR